MGAHVPPPQPRPPHPLVREGNGVWIYETAATVQLAESLWDSVGYAGMYIDYSEMEVPAPGEDDADAETEVRVFYDGAWHTVVYDFAPCRDVVGWVGDPVIFKMSAWAA